MDSNGLRINLVFPSYNKNLANAVARFGVVTGRQSSLDEALNWARNGSGEDPDIILINLGQYFRDVPVKTALINTICGCLQGIKDYRKKSRIVLLLPERQAGSQQLIEKLLGMRIYDFWFVDKFDETDIKNFVYHARTAAEAEAYLLDVERQNKILSPVRNLVMKPQLQQLYKPYYLKSNVVAFCSDDDAQVNYASAVLTALSLAEKGCRVALVESVSTVPQLACSLSIVHPFLNIRHALSMYMLGNNEFIRSCFFNTGQYLKDPHTPDPDIDLRYIPGGLYFLPDAAKDMCAPPTQMESKWRDFVLDLVRILLFENDFHYVIFIAGGTNFFNQVIFDEITGDKFITVNMLPGSIVRGLKLRKEKGAKIHLIGTGKYKLLGDEIKALQEEPLLYPPECFENDFLNFIYLKDYRKITSQSQKYINELLAAIGLKAEAAVAAGGKGC